MEEVSLIQKPEQKFRLCKGTAYLQRFPSIKLSLDQSHPSPPPPDKQEPSMLGTDWDSEF